MGHVLKVFKFIGFCQEFHEGHQRPDVVFTFLYLLVSTLRLKHIAIYISNMTIPSLSLLLLIVKDQLMKNSFG